VGNGAAAAASDGRLQGAAKWIFYKKILIFCAQQILNF